ncbi:MAG: flavodoxin family protein [Spirochaetes bacterium]|nr:flavodoxin family protein [Spirochaetota bacterium]
MKVLVIIGSPRKKNTYQIAQLFEKNINEIEKSEFKYIFLNEVNLEYCRGCGVCKNDENLCPIKDDALKIRDEMLNSDGIILTSPVYASHESALMKNFLDRFHYFHFRPMFFDKAAIILSTTGYRGLNEVLKYLNGTTRSWGCHIAGNLGVIMAFYHNKDKYKRMIIEEIKRISKKFIDIKKGIILREPDLNDLLLFRDRRETVIFCKEKYKDVYNYWKTNGWLNKNYYFDVKINLFKKILLKYKTFKLTKN